MRDVKMSPEKTEFKFEIGTGLDALPTRKYAKGSKYDAILEAFKVQPKKYAPVTVTGKDANYVCIQIKKRIKALDIKGVGVTVANGTCYLEKSTEAKPAKTK